MKLANFVSSCRHGRVVYKRGRAIFVNCGHCPDCQARRNRHYSNLCEVESLCYKFTYFFTLTYNDYNVPFALIKTNSSGTASFYDATVRCRYAQKTTDNHKKGDITSKYHLPEYGNEIARLETTVDDPIFNEFLDRSHTKSRIYEIPELQSKAIRYLRKADVQCFFKRFRNYVKQICDAQVSYFVCGEYGPKTFRPHYHVILYFDDPRLRSCLVKLLRKSWQLGRVYGVSSAKSTTAAAKYVSEYCNSLSYLPRYLSSPNLAPFSLHSRYFGSILDPYVRDYLYEDTDRAMGDSIIPNPFISVFHYWPTSRNQSLLFPRCYNYDNQTRTGRNQLYTCYSEFSKRRCFANISELAYCILASPDADSYTRNFLRRLDIFTVSDPPVPYCSDTDLIYTPSTFDRDSLFDLRVSLSDMDEFSRCLFTRVTTALYLSYNFLTFNCQGRNVSDVLTIIETYYKRSKLFKLSQFYEAQQEFEATVFDSDFSLFYPLSSSTLVSCHSDIVNVRTDFGFSVPYMITTSSTGLSEPYFQYRNSSQWLKMVNSKKDEQYRKCWKHKAQNEKNIKFN